MYPRDHLAIGFLFSILLSYLFFWPASHTVIVGYIFLGTAASVLIDTDHVFVKRYTSGEWRTSMKGVSIPPGQKYLSHLSVLAIFAAVSSYYGSEPGYFISSVLAVHILSDIYADNSSYWGWREGDL